MILPTKYIRTRHSLLAAGAVILRELATPMTVSSLWERVQNDPAVQTFGRFVLGVDLLYMTGTITMSRGVLRRSE